MYSANRNYFVMNNQIKKKKRYEQIFLENLAVFKDPLLVLALFVFILLFLFAICRLLFYNVHEDEAYYIYIVVAKIEGEVLYKDLMIQQPPLVFELGTIIYTFFPSYIILRFFTFFAGVLTIFFLFKLLDGVVNSTRERIFILIFLFSNEIFIERLTTFTPSIYCILLCMISTWLIIHTPIPNEEWNSIFGGILFIVAIGIKQSAALYIICLIPLLTFKKYQKRFVLFLLGSFITSLFFLVIYFNILEAAFNDLVLLQFEKESRTLGSKFTKFYTGSGFELFLFPAIIGILYLSNFLISQFNFKGNLAIDKQLEIIIILFSQAIVYSVLLFLLIGFLLPHHFIGLMPITATFAGIGANQLLELLDYRPKIKSKNLMLLYIHSREIILFFIIIINFTSLMTLESNFKDYPVWQAELRNNEAVVNFIHDNTPANSYILSDNGYIAVLAERKIPKRLGDIFKATVTSGIITTEQLIEAVEQYNVSAVVITFKFKFLPDFSYFSFYLVNYFTHKQEFQTDRSNNITVYGFF